MKNDEIRLTFPGMFNETLRKFGEHNAYAFAGEDPITYKTVYQEIRAQKTVDGISGKDWNFQR